MSRVRRSTEAVRALAAATDRAEARRRGRQLHRLLRRQDPGPAIPELVRLTGAGPVAVRETALVLLVMLAGGGRAATALEQAVPTYYELLHDPEPAVRAAAFVLVTVLEHRPLLPLSGDARITAQLDPHLTSPRYRRAVAHLHEHDWDRHVRHRLGCARIDPLFGYGAERYGVGFGL